MVQEVVQGLPLQEAQQLNLPLKPNLKLLSSNNKAEEDYWVALEAQ